MSERKQISTSIEAYNSLNADSVRAIYQKIVEALKILGSASTEKIAEYLGMEHAKVHKRTSEMERLEMIWRPGAKTLTKSGRHAFLWTIRGDHQPKTDEQEHNQFKKNVPASTDYAAKIIEQNNQYIQPNLFSL